MVGTTRLRIRGYGVWVVVFVLLIGPPGAAGLASGDERVAVGHAGANKAASPSQALSSGWKVWRVVGLRDYNTRVVVLGTVTLGIASGVVGVFTLLRKRALVGDVVSHAALPGIATAFLTMEIIRPGAGKWLPGLLLGAAAGGFAGILSANAIRRLTRLKDDAALAIVLSVYFGLGIALFTISQRLPTGNAAGLSHFIYGKAASMTAADVMLIASVSLAALVVCGLLFKELAVVAFDERYAEARGWPVQRLDLTLMGLVVVVSVVGLQSVGLLLVVAMLIIPATAARFWTDRLAPLAVLSGVLGGLSALGGVLISGLFPRVATGAIIVLCGSSLFLASLLIGRRHGVLRRILVLRSMQRQAARQHLLRAFYERIAGAQTVMSLADLSEPCLTPADLERVRAWSPAELRGILRRAEREGLIEHNRGSYRLTSSGAEAAQDAVRRHRLWELYLIHCAELAPGVVDRDADDSEHLLDAETLRLLEQRLGAHPTSVPPSPHPIRDRGKA